MDNIEEKAVNQNQNAENEKMLAIDRASYEMYEKTIAETVKNMKEKIDKDGNRIFPDDKIQEQVDLLKRSQEDIYDDYIARGGDPEELKKKKRVRKTKSNITDSIAASISESVNNAPSPKKEEKNVFKAEETFNRDLSFIPKKNSFENHESFDMIPLPSKGECYKTKTSKVPVSYLTAYDENMIIAPNLYRDNLIIDTILEQKVMSDEVATGDLLEGDRDAIILFLRASGYGNEYPITATDDVTGEQFDTTVDLSQIQFKPFNLKGDANGYFDYELPLSKDQIKFRFLSHQNNLDLQKFEEMENEVLKKARLSYFAGEIDEFIESDKTLDRAAKAKAREAVRTLENWSDSIDEEELLYTHSVTNRLEMSIMSVNGVTDRGYIRDYVRKMNVKDSSALRKYINENEPGLDYNLTIEKPESLGGGSMSVFLQTDQFIFLNIA